MSTYKLYIFQYLYIFTFYKITLQLTQITHYNLNNRAFNILLLLKKKNS